jgi:cell division protein FtsZ
MDLTIDEVTTIASIIQEAAGDDAEIIFGAVHDPTLEGEVRVTVIATGLERDVQPVQPNVIRPNFGMRTATPAVAAAAPAPVLAGVGAEPAYARQAATVSTPRASDFAEALPFSRPPQRPLASRQLTDLDIPTFIRRQMD